MKNCHFLQCNVNVDIENIANAIIEAGGRIKTATIQFPDPHFKSKHAKRRVVPQDFVGAIAASMLKTRVGDEHVFLQSDVKNVLDLMREEFRQNDSFVDTVSDAGDYLQENFTGVPTERENGVLEKGGDVYRSLFKLKPS